MPVDGSSPGPSLRVAKLFALGWLGLTVPSLRAQTASLTLSGDPGLLQIVSAVPGLPPSAVTENSTTYNVSTTYGSLRILARLSAPPPAGVTLEATLQAPAGGTSRGAVTLGLTDQDMVTGIPTGDYTNLTITYRLTATSASGVVTTAAPSVTFTVTSP